MTELSLILQRRIRKRTIILSFFLFLWFFGLTLRLIQLQVIEHKELRTAALSQNQLQREILPERGTIYDRKGKILARSLPSPSVFFIPYDGESKEQHIQKILALKNILSLSRADLQRIKTRIEKGDPFIWIKRKIEPQEAERVRALDLGGIYFQDETKRSYPLGTLAAHVLGGVDIDDRGASGVEYQYNAKLEGKKGLSLILRDAKKRRYDWEVLKAPVPGEDLVLTIDETIQYIAERELEKAVHDHQAEWGTVIVTHPSSGEILAMASYPTYDPNGYPPEDPETERNNAIRNNFEPGSTFKIVTAAAALESGTVGLSDTFDCSAGRITIAGWTISDHKKMGYLSFPEVIIHSSNVGTIQVGQRIGPENLFHMIKAFHFGERTGIDLPGEEAGICHDLKKWSRLSVPSLSIGYEISVTALQVLQTMNIIANKGVLVPPAVARKSLDFRDPSPPVPSFSKRIISETTASKLIPKVFEKVVLEGTGQAAQIDGYTVAGKTGTAQKMDPEIRAYSPRKHLASFVGFVPAEKPLISMIVVIDEPKNSLHYGGQVAAPVFREIARRVLLYLREPPQASPPKTMITARIGRGSWR